MQYLEVDPGPPLFVLAAAALLVALLRLLVRFAHKRAERRTGQALQHVLTDQERAK